MRRRAVLFALVLGALGAACLPVKPPPPPPGPVVTLERIGGYTTGLADVGAEVLSGEVASLKNDRLYVSNAADISVDIVDVADPTNPTLLTRLDLSPYGSEVTSVAAGDGLVAATVDAGTAPGQVVFFSENGNDLRSVEVGAGPDQVSFTPDNERVLVANEGEPSGYNVGDVDPPGTVNVIDNPWSDPIVQTIGFEAFDPGQPRAGELPSAVRIFGSTLPSLDLEPEYLTPSDDGRTAWVSLQENNAIAVLDLDDLTVTRIDALGFKDHSLAGNGLDGSDQDGGFHTQPWPNIFGMYQPDALAAFEVDDQPYVLSANEGDAREWPGLLEAARLRSTTTDTSFGLNRANNVVGRLNVTTKPPGSPSDQAVVYAFGARSFSIWNGSTGALTFDSADALEQLTNAELPDNFNSNHDENTFDNRSDDKGPEPEAAAAGEIDGRRYGFIGFERIGGFILIDLSDPTSPEIVQYLNHRDFSTDAVGPDSGPEVIDFVPPSDSPTGVPLVVVANEITGSVSIYAPVAA